MVNYIRQNRANPGGYASFLVRFSRWESGEMSGNLWSAYSERPKHFRGLEELLEQMTTEMDSIRCPPVTNSEQPPVASGQDIPKWRRESGAKHQNGFSRAAAVQVRRRQRGSMQGEIQTCDGGQNAFFRSEKELLELLKDVGMNAGEAGGSRKRLDIANASSWR